MHEDPTRMMSQPDPQRPHGNMRLLVAGLIAVIVGLAVAIVVIAGDSDDGATSTVTTAPTETAPTTETTTGSTTETTEPTTTETTETTTTEPTTTTTPTTPTDEEEGPGSGGVPAP
jgi:cytoskeletal protein RodZ